MTHDKAKWKRTPCEPLVIEPDLQLLKCDTQHIMDEKWSQAVEKGDLEKYLLHSPDQYVGVDYLLKFNHGIFVTTGLNHSIAKGFLTKLQDIFKHCKGKYSFTLSFFRYGRARKVRPGIRRGVQKLHGDGTGARQSV